MMKVLEQIVKQLPTDPSKSLMEDIDPSKEITLTLTTAEVCGIYEDLTNTISHAKNILSLLHSLVGSTPEFHAVMGDCGLEFRIELMIKIGRIINTHVIPPERADEVAEQFEKIVAEHRANKEALKAGIQ